MTKHVVLLWCMSQSSDEHLETVDNHKPSALVTGYPSSTKMFSYTPKVWIVGTVFDMTKPVTGSG